MRTANRSGPGQSNRSGSTRTKIGQWNRYSPYDTLPTHTTPSISSTATEPARRVQAEDQRRRHDRDERQSARRRPDRSTTGTARRRSRALRVRPGRAARPARRRRRPAITTARNAPMMISLIRAGVAQYAASAPHTAAMIGAETDVARAIAADDDESAATAGHAAQHHEHQRRPHPVELLLDRQRPEVLERRRRTAGYWAEQVLVGAVAGEEHPVGDLEQRAPRSCDRRSATPSNRSVVADRIGDADQAQDARRQQPSESPGVERRGGRSSRTACSLQEQTRDQEAGQREEHRDAEIAAAEPRNACVEQQHDDHGKGSHTVQGRLVGDRRTIRHASRKCRARPR